MEIEIGEGEEEVADVVTVLGVLTAIVCISVSDVRGCAVEVEAFVVV